MNDETRAELVHEVNKIISDNDYHIQKMDTEKASVPIVDMFARLLTDRAVPEPAADAVERAAEAIYVTNQASAVPRDKRWWITPFEEIVVDAQERYRDMARAALQAALAAAKGTEGSE